MTGTLRRTPRYSAVSVNHASTASTAYALNARYKRMPDKTFWWTGEDSNLRSSKERQIYSLLPLTARPPVHNLTEPFALGATGEDNKEMREHTSAHENRVPGKVSRKECVPSEEPARR